MEHHARDVITACNELIMRIVLHDNAAVTQSCLVSYSSYSYS